MNDALRRVTDLFVEGRVLELDPENRLWIQKLNSFEVEEARRDGVAARSLRMIELNDPDNSELKAQQWQTGRFTEAELRDRRVGQMGDELYLDVINDVEADPDWVEKLATVRRLPDLLDDQGAAEDDPRRKQLQDINVEYLGHLREKLDKASEAALRDLEGMERKDLEESYLEAWRQRATLGLFMEERRVSELYFSIRQCSARKAEDGWKHDGCTHERLLNGRSEVRNLPDAFTEKVADTLESVTVPERESGNSDAPASSSASSEPSSAQAETSAASSPEATSVAAATT